jgi:hypothetical protein
VPATLDGGGVLYASEDPAEVAARMQAILDDHRRQDEILERQDAALARLRARDFDGLVLRFVEQVLNGPRLPPAAVALDFWQQFAVAQELEDIRQSRPAAFRALPPPPDAGTIADLEHRR